MRRSERKGAERFLPDTKGNYSILMLECFRQCLKAEQISAKQDMWDIWTDFNTDAPAEESIKMRIASQSHLSYRNFKSTCVMPQIVTSVNPDLLGSIEAWK